MFSETSETRGRTSVQLSMVAHPAHLPAQHRLGDCDLNNQRRAREEEVNAERGRFVVPSAPADPVGNIL